MKNVILISSAQPSANPRLIKEAKTLFDTGYSVSVIWCPLSIWADELDRKLITDFPDINWVKGGYHAKSQPIMYWYARVRQKIWQLVYKFVGDQSDAAIKSLVLFSQELTSIALEHKADLYIGHNLGALPATVKASKKYNAKSIFDFEDYHRGELEKNAINTKMTIKVENRYVPHISSVTAASPSISLRYGMVFPYHLSTTINNCFPLEYAVEQVKLVSQHPLKLFWFSQYVGKKRGLEAIITSMSFFSDKSISLTLLGFTSAEMRKYFLNLMIDLNLSEDQLTFLDPVKEVDIVSIASNHHIGIASEPGRDLNNDLALSNKIMMYLLAGNALLCSDTVSQKDFLDLNPSIGSLYLKDNPTDLSRVLSYYLNNPELLNDHRKNALQLGKERYNWNVEKKKFLLNVEQVLAK
jgi:glycosyltransferase involved in cell wall biosynthesis